MSEVDILQPKRTVAELKELRALTGDENGAQRVAFTPTWAKARDWLKAKMAELPVESHTDAAGNVWFTLKGESEKSLLIGGHIDSVPNGGWLDGCLNVMAGVEILLHIEQGPVLLDRDIPLGVVLETCGVSHRMPSGPLHDAAEVSRAGIPTVMMFVPSLHGISHNKIEDTREDHLELCGKPSTGWPGKRWSGSPCKLLKCV